MKYTLAAVLGSVVLYRVVEARKLLHLAGYPLRIAWSMLPKMGTYSRIVEPSWIVCNGIAKLTIEEGVAVLVRVPEALHSPFPYIEVKGLLASCDADDQDTWISLRTPLAHLWHGKLPDTDLIKAYFGVSRVVCIDLSLDQSEL